MVISTSEGSVVIDGLLSLQGLFGKAIALFDVVDRK